MQRAEPGLLWWQPIYHRAVISNNKGRAPPTLEDMRKMSRMPAAKLIARTVSIWQKQQLKSKRIPRGVDHYRKYCARNIFLYGIHWNTSGILGTSSIIFSKSDPKLDKIWQIGHISEILRNIFLTRNIVSGPPIGIPLRNESREVETELNQESQWAHPHQTPGRILPVLGWIRIRDGSNTNTTAGRRPRPVTRDLH